LSPIQPEIGTNGTSSLDHRLLPADLLEHLDHLVADLGVARLTVLGDVAVHLVHADDDLLHAEQVDQQRVLTGLAHHLTGLRVALGDRGREVAVGRHHDQRDVGLRRAGDHVLDKVAVTGRIDHGVVLGRREELLRGARNRHTALALLLLTVQKEGKDERRLAETLSLLQESKNGEW
jgi:hypothetical protein